MWLPQEPIRDLCVDVIQGVIRMSAKGLPVHLELWNGQQIDLSPNSSLDSKIRAKVNQPSGLLALLSPNLARLGEAYVEGAIDIEGSPLQAIRVLGEWSEARAGKRSRSWRPRRRGKKTDKESVQYHYDVSNDFYRLILDQQMVYSCAYFRSGKESLEQAQEEKLDLICRKLLLKPGERFLDIGCGWGALIRWAAKNYGVRATGITVSKNQYQFVKSLIREEGLRDRCEIRFLDYRDLRAGEPYDKIASIGMFEHVGLAQMDSYFRRVGLLLREGGLMLNHGICSAELDQRYVGDGAGGAFLDRYVFPNGELPHVSFATRSMSAQNFEVADVESLRPHYVETLSNWLSRLEENREEAIRAAGEKRYRVWRAYLAGCAHAFERGWISVYQVLAAKRSPSGAWSLPRTREHLYEEREKAQ